MTSPATTPPEHTDAQLYGMAEDFLDALLSAADVDTIGRANWWDRAKTALETAAGASDSWRQCVSRAVRKLQIETPDERLSQITAQLAAQLDNPAVFRRWARLAERDAPSITAIVRDRRANRHATKTGKSESKPGKSDEKEQECLPF